MTEREDTHATSDHGGGSSTEPLINLSSTPTVTSNYNVSSNIPLFKVPETFPSVSSNNRNATSIQSTSKESNANVIAPSTVPLLSQVLKQRPATVFPKKNQAIIFTALEGIPIKEYIVNLGNLIGPKNISFASKISNNRVCIYLSSKECVDSFISQHAGISIGDVYVAARRMITPANRVILSNVSPIIPHEIIENVLKISGLKTVSPVSFVGVGLGMSEYAHIYSFRRQVYIVPDENTELPSSLIIDFEGDAYRIFLSNDDLKCFLCKTTGHISKHCPNVPKQTTAPISVVSTTEERNTDPAVAAATGKNLQTTPHLSIGIKRLASNEPQVSDVEQTTTQPNKSPKPTEHHKSPSRSLQSVPKRKKNTRPDPPEIFEDLKPIFGDQQFLLNFADFQSFLREAKGNSRPKSVARKYTNDLPSLIGMLHDIHPIIQNRALKERCKRLVVSLSKESESSVSMDSSSEISDSPL